MLLLVLLCVTTIDAQIFPSACIPREKNPVYPVTCCPDYKGSPCGSALNRGSCMPRPSSRSEPPPDIRGDDRNNFSSFYFNATCSCKGNFYGPNCGGCRYGRVGENCDRAVVYIRREGRQMTLKERTRYIAQLNYCKKKIDPDYVILRTGDRFRIHAFVFIPASYYDVWCYTHYYATKPFLSNNVEFYFLNYAHGGPAFLAWHRLFLLNLERQMRKCLKDPTFTLAYYDWSNDPDCFYCQDGFLGGNDIQGRLSKFSIFSTWRMCCGGKDYPGTYCLMSDCICERSKIVRRPGMTLGFPKPTRQQVDGCMGIPNIDYPPFTSSAINSSRNCIEGFRDHRGNGGTFVHNAMHVYIGGTMAEVPIACNDLMFVFHHVYIDKLMELYMVRWGITPAHYPQSDIYGHGPYDCAGCFYECWYNRNLYNPSTSFGYQYSDFP